MLKNSLIAKSVVLGLIGSTALFMSSCEEKGPAEKAGEKLDEAVEDLEKSKDAEDVGEAIDKLTEKEDKNLLEKAGEKLQEVGDDIKDAAEE